MVVLECGTVQGDSVSTAMLLNNTCVALEKETGCKVSRVVHGTPVDGSAPILSLRLKKSMVRGEGKSFTLAEVPDIARQLTKATGEAAKDVGHAPKVEDAAAKGGMTVTAAEDVGDMVVLECGTVQGDSVSTAMLLNNTCVALEKETGCKVSRVVHGTPVDGSAPILSLRLKKSMVRGEGKSFTLAEVPDIARQLTAEAA